jgi:NAD(P)-dependent dehydrogenase (short-subunit alcohol dehydrogenase family)
VNPLAESGITSISGYGTDWLYLFVPLLVAAGIAALAVRHGEAPAGAQRGTRTLLRFADGMARATGFPAYAAAGATTCLAFLLVAALGFYWDVAWHVDYGRDALLFTPAHTAIIVGLQGLLVSAAVTTLVATWTRADVRLRFKGLRMPWGAATLFALGTGAVAAFPLDELWHRAYGVDVTMWGPTHLGMIGGASFGPLALLLLVREAGGTPTRLGRRLTAVLCMATLLGLSTFQLEFDLGVPQWQHLYHPVLIALASGFALVVARLVIGRGGAVFAALDFTAQRIVTALVVGRALHHTAPHWALYLGSAVAIEAAAALTRRRAPLVQALAYGAAVSAGLATEWAWTQVWGRHPWGTALLPGIGVAVVAAFAAALLGTAAGRRLRGREAGIPWPVLALAGVAVLGSLVVPFPRHAAPATATVRTTAAGRDEVNVDVTVDHPQAVEDADWFDVFAWQGGSFHRSPLKRVGPAEWRTERPVPVGGSWKTMVRLAKHDTLAGVPVSFPYDRAIGAPAIPVAAVRTLPMRRDTVLLMRESHHGDTLPALIAYLVLGSFAALWVTTLVVGLRSPRLRCRAPLDGARVVVTGALGGIGLAVTESLRAHGAQVVGVDLVAGDGVVAGDVTSAESMRTAMRAAAGRLGGIDLLVNLAGIGRAQDTGDFPGDDARRVLDVNLFGTWNACAAALPWLVESGGHVVVTASGLATVNVPWAAAYAASKRAVSAYADTLRLEYAGRLTVSVVNPGYVRTPIHDVAAASGASLEGLVPADEMAGVVDAYVTACTAKPRSVATSRRTAFGLRVAGRRPALADRVVLASLRRLGRPAPSFVLQSFWTGWSSSSSRSTPGKTNQKNTVVAATSPEATPAKTPPYTTVDTR